MAHADLHDLQTPPDALVHRWRLRGTSLDLTTPQIMAICNVTPDSFSDGGKHDTVERAVQFAADAWAQGASILDVGGESTRPGATPVSASDEAGRVLPVIAAVRQQLPEMLVTIDTVKAVVADAALHAGAHAVNDVSGGRLDAAMFATVAAHDGGMVIMHSRGTVADMASFTHAEYGDDVVGVIATELQRQVTSALASGISADALVLDPGIGFAKTSAHSLAVLRELPRLLALGHPLLVGASRKRVIGELTGVRAPEQRVLGSAVAHALAVMGGARIIRAHDVAATREALAVATGVLRGSPSGTNRRSE